jgi:hypothetical protein
MRVIDKSRIIMFEVGTSSQVRNFYGANNGEYANPRLIWSLNGKYVYTTTEDMQLATFDVASGRLISTTKASDKIVVKFAFLILQSLCFSHSLQL